MKEKTNKINNNDNDSSEKFMNLRLLHLPLFGKKKNPKKPLRLKKHLLKTNNIDNALCMNPMAGVRLFIVSYQSD